MFLFGKRRNVRPVVEHIELTSPVRLNTYDNYPGESDDGTGKIINLVRVSAAITAHGPFILVGLFGVKADTEEFYGKHIHHLFVSVCTTSEDVLSFKKYIENLRLGLNSLINVITLKYDHSSRKYVAYNDDGLGGVDQAPGHGPVGATAIRSIINIIDKREIARYENAIATRATPNERAMYGGGLKRTKPITQSSKPRKLHTGPKGGRYYIMGGRKVYVRYS
jgi:hypothetical protein